LSSGGPVRSCTPTSGELRSYENLSRRLLGGTCTLFFEGKSFVADGAGDPQFGFKSMIACALN